MTPRQSSDLTLAADYSGSGAFSAVGMLLPSFALDAAMGRFRLYRGDPKKRPVLIHALATKIVGRCFLESAEAERALFECFAARLAAEWTVTMPALGILRALFLIERLERSELEGLFDLVLQLAGQPSLCELQAENAETD
ncbi:MAG: hypothetical protein WAN43_00195 [Rhodomicrobium sp.]|jgi:hypothetical protein